MSGLELEVGMEEPPEVPTDGSFFTSEPLYAEYVAKSEKGFFASRDVRSQADIHNFAKRIGLKARRGTGEVDTGFLYAHAPVSVRRRCGGTVPFRSVCVHGRWALC